jgi:SAM-dependent methyltransferase
MMPTRPQVIKNKVSVSRNHQRLENLVLNLRGREWQKLPSKERMKVVDMCFRYWRARGFPYYQLSDLEIIKDYDRLAAASKEQILLGDEVQISMVGVKLANYFHPQMWCVPVNGAHSPIERFNDDEQLRKLIRRALTIWSDRYSVNEINLRGMLRTFSNTARVSNFRPTAAKALYEQYSKDGDTVLDFSAGYGGRLLGCLPLDRRYIGIDPCKDQARGLRNMVRTLKRLARPKALPSIHQQCAEDFLPLLEAGSVSLVFSSPPYFNHERYSDEPSQSYIRYPTYDEWLETFLGKVVAESQRVLKPGGHLLLNVADVNGLKLAADVFRIASRYFTPVGILKLRLGHKPYLRHRTGKAFKYESLFVFRKSRRR